jgi:tRNA(fMet)-specific endonuclease VapC
VLIAGQAMARELTLITHNTREFRRVPGLKVEDWKGSAVRRQRRNNP